MPATQIPHHAWILIADGGRAIIVRNDGQPKKPKLALVRQIDLDNPPTREQGTDKPGRTNASTGIRRSSIESTDFHQQAEDRLMRDVADSLAEDLRQQSFSQLIVAAAPEALGALRKAMSGELQKAVIAEVPKDFTKVNLPDLGPAIDKALEPAA